MPRKLSLRANYIIIKKVLEFIVSNGQLNQPKIKASKAFNVGSNFYAKNK